MQREEFIQQLWLDFIHQYPEIGGLRLWPLDAPVEYLALLTLNHRHHGMDALLPALERFGYRIRHRHAMADRGLLVNLLAPPGDGPWLAVAELQMGTLARRPGGCSRSWSTRHPRLPIVAPTACAGGGPGRCPTGKTTRPCIRLIPWPPCSPSTGHACTMSATTCQHLEASLDDLHRGMEEAGFAGTADRHHGLFPISPLVDYRFYPSGSRRLPFAEGDEHRVETGGIALVQKSVSAHQERVVELLLPHHTRCELS